MDNANVVQGTAKMTRLFAFLKSDQPEEGSTMGNQANSRSGQLSM
jgi:hypothetical protein